MARRTTITGTRRASESPARQEASSNDDRETTRSLAPYIDHTLLDPEAGCERLQQLCDEARKHAFHSVCVASAHVEFCANELSDTRVEIVAVAGFPLGTSSTASKAFETARAVNAGADEIDVVIARGMLKCRDYAFVVRDLREVVQAAEGRPVKAILETGALQRDEKVIACALAVAAGASFVKTSTGFGGSGATVEDIALMRSVVGETIGVKASGGIRDAATAWAMIEAGASRIGASASVAMVSPSGATRPDEPGDARD